MNLVTLTGFNRVVNTIYIYNEQKMPKKMIFASKSYIIQKNYIKKTLTFIGFSFNELNTIIKCFHFCLVFTKWISKCNNNNSIDGCHLAKHEGLLKPRQVLLGSTSSRPTIPVEASPIPHVGLKATINGILLSKRHHVLIMENCQ